MTSDKIVLKLDDPDNPHYEYLEYARALERASESLPKGDPECATYDRLFCTFFEKSLATKQGVRSARASKSIGVHMARAALHVVIDFYVEQLAGDEKKALSSVSQAIRLKDRRTRWTPSHLRRCILDWTVRQKEWRTSLEQELLTVNVWRRFFKYDLNVMHGNDRERRALQMLASYAQLADDSEDAFRS